MRGLHTVDDVLGLSTNYSSSSATTMDVSSEHNTSTDEAFQRPIYWIVIGSMAAFLCLVILCTTRCCRVLNYDRRLHVDASERERRQRMRAELEAAEANLRLVEQAKRAKKRKKFLERVLPLNPYKECRDPKDTVDEEEETVDEEQEKDGVCPICLEKYQDGDILAGSTVQRKWCLHEFHRECIASWLLSHKECPVCRNVFLRQDLGKNEEMVVGEDEEEGGPHSNILSTTDGEELPNYNGQDEPV